MVTGSPVISGEDEILSFNLWPGGRARSEADEYAYQSALTVNEMGECLGISYAQLDYSEIGRLKFRLPWGAC
jgi:hypothetical protein